VNELEEGSEPRIDFEKLRKVGAREQGVVPVVLQDAESGAVLWVAYANEEALRETLRTRRAVLWSTSRGELWRKGATSGDWLELVEVRVNCEQNSLLYRVRPRGSGVCHTREPDGRARATCFYRVLAPEGDALAFVPPSRPRVDDAP
jgi:phosphoribosyl-AMP cyclohydrolase